VNDNFRRTPEQIVEQRSGNCAELASVLRAFLDALGVKSRWISEINFQPTTNAARQRTAEEKADHKRQR
jgi:transglutaminase-like putative cysteine protease